MNFKQFGSILRLVWYFVMFQVLGFSVCCYNSALVLDRVWYAFFILNLGFMQKKWGKLILFPIGYSFFTVLFAFITLLVHFNQTFWRDILTTSQSS